MKKPLIATPVSTLIMKNIDHLDKVLEFSQCFEVRDFSISFAKQTNEIKNKTLLFHCELQPIHKLSMREINYIIDNVNFFPNLKILSLHVASCYKNPKFIDYKFEANGPLIKKNKLLKNFYENIEVLKTKLGDDITILIENNNYYNTEAYKYVCEPNFLNTLCLQNNVSLLLDISHAKISAINMKKNSLDYKHYINQFLADKVKQIHISKHCLKENGEAYDAHLLPGIDELKEIEYILKKFKNIQYLTIEFYKDILDLIKVLKKLRTLIYGT